MWRPESGSESGVAVALADDRSWKIQVVKSLLTLDPLM